MHIRPNWRMLNERSLDKGIGKPQKYWYFWGGMTAAPLDTKGVGRVIAEPCRGLSWEELSLSRTQPARWQPYREGIWILKTSTTLPPQPSLFSLILFENFPSADPSVISGHGILLTPTRGSFLRQWARRRRCSPFVSFFSDFVVECQKSNMEN